MEQHIVLLSEPGSIYIGHKTPDSKSSQGYYTKHHQLRHTERDYTFGISCQ